MKSSLSTLNAPGTLNTPGTLNSLSNRHQSGSISAVVVFVLIVVISAMLVASLNMSSSSLSDQNQNRDAIQALFAAESAIERAKFILKNDSGVCVPANLIDGVHSYTNTNLSISFEIAQALADSPAAGDCTIKVTGTSNNITRYIDITMVNAGGTGGPGIADYQFTEPFTTLTWLNNTTASNGTTSVGIDPAENCPSATCANSNDLISGAFDIHTGSSNASITGYIETPVSISIGATAQTGYFDIAMRYFRSYTGPPPSHTTSLWLINTTAPANDVELVTESRRNQINTWTTHLTNPHTFPANATYDRIRIYYNLNQSNRTGSVDVWVDEVDIFIQGIAGGVAPDWQVTTWQEIDALP